MKLRALFHRIDSLVALVTVFVLGCSVVNSPSAAAAEPIRPQAVVNLTFDEVGGDAYDSGSAGRHKDHGKFINGARRVPSPFWGQRGGESLLLNAARKQFVKLADSRDVGRSDALSLSFFFLSLHDFNDAATRGIVAKQSEDKKQTGTNYGINYVAKDDRFQVYVHDGIGLHVAGYRVKQVVGYRRRVFLTATFQVGDAPAPDEDTDIDDVRVQLFVNGQPVKPTKVEPGVAAGDAAWLTDVKLDGLFNDAPLTLGSTNSQAEFTSGLIDEFSLFARALTPQEVAQLFLEVAGPKAVELAQQELQPQGPPPAPKIISTSLRGLQTGKTTRLTISGENLARQPRVELPDSNLKQTVVQGSNAGRLIVDLTIPADMPPGYYPLSVQTADGLSNSVVMAVDRLPQFSAEDTSPDKPATLPAAFSGMLSGDEQKRIYFQGKAGQRIVADVDARRLGAGMDPVLEIKTARGTPLAIEWAKVYLRGDARAEITLPADGLYYVELHDLSYNAPGRNPYRLKIGDIKIIDSFFPPTTRATATVNVEPVGIGILPGSVIVAKVEEISPGIAALVKLPLQLGPLGPAPAIRLSNGIEVVEIHQTHGQLQMIDARFPGKEQVPIVVNGRISEPGEVDRYYLAVEGDQKLNFRLDARSIDSPLDGRLSVVSEGRVLIVKEDRPGSRDPAFDYSVPKLVKQIQIHVGDLHGRGGPHFLYRLRIVPAGRPDFSLSVTTAKLVLPENGTAIVRLQLNRDGYNGPVKLRVVGDRNVTISPAQLPAGSGHRKTFITLTRNGGDKATGLRRLRILGESTGLNPELRRVARISPGPGQTVVPGYQDQLPALIVKPVSLSVDVAKIPEVLFKGVNAEVDLNVVRSGDGVGQALQLALMSNEPPRQVDPKKPKQGHKPLVRSLPCPVAFRATSGKLKVAVPLDVAAGEIDFVIRADLKPHAYSPHTLGTVYSKPFRIVVRDAVSVKLDPKSFNLVAGTQCKIRGTVKRTAGFTGSVDVKLSGFPQGYSAAKVTVPPGQEQFELRVTAAEEDKPKELPMITLTVATTGGGAILPNRTIPLRVTPAARSGPLSSEP
jgi:hypothetical protein